MKKTIGDIFAKVGSFFIFLSRKIYMTPFQKQKNVFKKIIGDSTNFECALDEHSVVFDVGGYEGQWASDVYSKYNCRIHIFEPVPSFVESIKKRFARNPNITVHSFGLSDITKKEKIFLQNDSSSTIKKSEQATTIQLKSIMDFIRENNISRIDLVKINIEGGEYALLSSLIDSGFIKSIGCLLIQFHDFFPDAKKKMEELQARMSQTHRLEYQFRFVWELWKLK